VRSHGSRSVATSYILLSVIPRELVRIPWFTVRDDKLYPAFGHPEGIGAIRRSL
jgi:hypothetical protein